MQALLRVYASWNKYVERLYVFTTSTEAIDVSLIVDVSEESSNVGAGSPSLARILGDVYDRDRDEYYGHMTAAFEVFDFTFEDGELVGTPNFSWECWFDVSAEQFEQLRTVAPPCTVTANGLNPLIGEETEVEAALALYREYKQNRGQA